MSVTAFIVGRSIAQKVTGVTRRYTTGEETLGIHTLSGTNRKAELHPEYWKPWARVDDHEREAWPRFNFLRGRVGDNAEE